MAEGILKPRVLMRAEQYCRNAKENEMGPLPSSPVDDVIYISRIILDVYRRHLLTPAGTLDVDQCWGAFERFSNGELRVKLSNSVWNGEPDGAYEFSFAEFAFMAIEANINVKEWTTLLPSLVASQVIYTKAYEPDRFFREGGYLYELYGTDTFKPEQQVKTRFKTRLRKKYDALSLEELKVAAGKNAFLAFPAGSTNRRNECFQERFK
jgi:hypothetical protein